MPKIPPWAEITGRGRAVAVPHGLGGDSLGKGDHPTLYLKSGFTKGRRRYRRRRAYSADSTTSMLNVTYGDSSSAVEVQVRVSGFDRESDAVVDWVRAIYRGGETRYRPSIEHVLQLSDDGWRALESLRNDPPSAAAEETLRRGALAAERWRLWR